MENEIFLSDSDFFFIIIKLLQNSYIIKIINWLANCCLSIIISLSATSISSCLFLKKEKRINMFMSSDFCLSISSTIQQLSLAPNLVLTILLIPNQLFFSPYFPNLDYASWPGGPDLKFFFLLYNN